MSEGMKQTFVEKRFLAVIPVLRLLPHCRVVVTRGCPKECVHVVGHSSLPAGVAVCLGMYEVVLTGATCCARVDKFGNVK